MFDFIKANPALTVSIISLIISLYNFIYSLYTRHKKISIDFICYNLLKTPNNFFNYTFKVIIKNHSQLPISITNISLNNIDCENSLNYIAKKTYHNKGNISEDKFYGIQLPLNLPCLVSSSCFIRFATTNKIDFNNFVIDVYTNRGLIKNCEIKFSDSFKEVKDITS